MDIVDKLKMELARRLGGKWQDGNNKDGSPRMREPLRTPIVLMPNEVIDIINRIEEKTSEGEESS